MVHLQVLAEHSVLVLCQGGTGLQGECIVMGVQAAVGSQWVNADAAAGLLVGQPERSGHGVLLVWRNENSRFGRGVGPS